MTELVYEQPLNEKIRSYLRLEYLDKQLQSNLNHDHQHRCFYPLFSLCELSERCDYRNEVLKDIERHLLQLSKWQELDHVDHQQIDLYINALTQAREPLQKPERFGSQLKQDRFISALRQRFGMPGACCNFDLPQLHYWLAKPWEENNKTTALGYRISNPYSPPSPYCSNSPAAQPITTMPLPMQVFIRVTVLKHLLWCESKSMPPTGVILRLAAIKTVLPSILCSLNNNATPTVRLISYWLPVHEAFTLMA